MNSMFKDEPASQKTNTINNRLFARNRPSQALQPYLDGRAVTTKFSVMPIVDLRRPVETPLRQAPTYDIKTTFNPGNNFAPWSGYASNVNNESSLRNQFYGLQSCSQSVYVPSSQSDLYQVQWNQQQLDQPFPGLFKIDIPAHSLDNNGEISKNIGYEIFNNATRQQNKEANKDC